MLASCASPERAEILSALADMLVTRTDRFVELIVGETGKLYREAVSEVRKSIECLRYYADNADAILKRDAIFLEDGSCARVSYQPIGNVLAVMPWNFPLWQVVRCLAPNILLGNGIALKHASNVQGCAEMIEEWVTETLNLRVLVNLRVSSDAVAALIRDSRIQAVTLTGSDKAGAAVAEIAGSCLKKTVLELGGSDPYVVLHDADVEHAAHVCMKSRLINSGQSCIAAKRFIVAKDIYDDFLEAALSYAKRYTAGDPYNEETTFAPLAKAEYGLHIHKAVQDAVMCGARVLCGGKHHPQSAFYPVTILADVNETMQVFHDEIFGPVASVIPFDNERHALFLANFTNYGLGGAVFSKNETRALSFAAKINTGGVAINDMYRSTPQAPFGGIGKSGYGRELGGADGLREFANVKTYLMNI